MHSQIVSKVNQAILNAIQNEPNIMKDETLCEMIHYSLGFSKDGTTLSPGKRLRPLFCCLCCGSVSSEWENAVLFSAGLEMLHNCFLIHDDIEDDSDTRHNLPTVWKKWGLSLGLNAGDALYGLSFRTIRQASQNHGGYKALEIFERTVSSLTLGQHYDISFESQESVSEADYIRMISGKTASLIGCCCALGALAGNAPDDEITRFFEMGSLIGLAFQMRDDYLGIWGDEQAFGKSISSDIMTKKKTLPILYALNHDETFRQKWDAFNGEKSEVQWFARRMSENGAKEYTQDQCADYTKQAREIYAAINPRPEFSAPLSDLIASLLERQK